ncbi:MAG: proline--tRNA ligase [Chloroflexi bacterium]|nr:proline--tRNA ligase [Chloroflexota bacterium]MCI0575825.1 proline--tRNA ligase [Chloroflexota bacterium]MCI0646552.1 proline--tRNA ligase [Chloroflexota bacterium]MCI0726354.1 proline--tRNA ligase [Chloroflexota bacterium]
MSRAFGKTVREAPAEAELISHQLLIRGNFVRPLASGIYTFMPLGHRVLRKIWAIMAEEMEAIGGQEMWMPNLHPAAIYQATGRWPGTFGPILMRLKGQGNRDYAISPTHEEVITDLALREVESYRDLPQFVYHISKKFRDEPRARGGLVRLREFIMKDAYSLDRSEEALDDFYPAILQAYRNIFARCGVQVVQINADVGAMGGKSSHEFTVPHPQGEDIFIACRNCDYAANVEAAEFIREGDLPAVLAPLVRVATPNCKTIADVAAYVGVPVSQTVKAVFYWWTPAGKKEADGRFVFGLVRGDLEINEVKLVNAVGNGELRPATTEEITAGGTVPGYASAVGLPVARSFDEEGVYVVADISIQAGGNFVVGANEEGTHFTGANYPRDFAVSRLADIAQADTGHQCPVCGGRIEARRAIEVGHCFKLGIRYSAPTNATYLDENNKPQLIYMGSYGIGLDRLMAVVVELHHDSDGVIWPASVAPYDIHLMHVGRGDEARDTAEKLYKELQKAGHAVYYDDRDVSAGVKFKDADLIGIPRRVAVSARGLAEGCVEVKRRDRPEQNLVPIDNLLQYLKNE